MPENEVSSNNAKVNEPVTTQPKPKAAVPICQQIKDNGVRCGTPAIRGQHFCYFHIRAHRPSAPIGHRDYMAPVMESKQSAEIAVTHALQAIASGQITTREANSMFYGIHLATKILRMKEPPAEAANPNTVTEISPVMQRTLEGRPIPSPADYEPANVAKLAACLLHSDELSQHYKILQAGRRDPRFRISRYHVDGHFEATRTLAEMGLLHRFTLKPPEDALDPAESEAPRKEPAGTAAPQAEHNSNERCS